VRRVIWALIGAIAAAVALLASPDTYARLRSGLFGGESASLEPPDVGVADVPEQIVSDAGGETEASDAADAEQVAESERRAAPAGVSDAYADEIRNRIEEARARVRERAGQARADDESAA
jgi:hypothetical protein